MSRRRRCSAVSRTGSVEKPKERADGAWACKLRWFDGDGRRQCETAYGDTATKARDAARRLLHKRLQEAAEERAGVRIRPKERPPTLAEVALRAETEFLSTRQSPDQVLRTLAALARYWEAPFGARPVDEVTAAEIRKVLAGMRTAGRSAAYCNRVLSALSVVLEAAVEWGHLERNPARSRGLRQRELRKIPRFLDDDEAADFLEAADGQWRPLFWFLLYTGCRFSEGRDLRWRDVDLVRRVAHIRRAKTGARTVRLPPKLIAELGRAGAPGDLVFPSSRPKVPGKPDPTADTISTPQKAMTKTLRAAGIKRHLSVHDLRHTHATLYLWQGGNLRTLQANLGHSTPYMTFRYLHVVEGMRKKAEPRLKLVDDGEG